MSDLRLVHLAECPPRPWRNGGGVARDLLRWPTASEDLVAGASAPNVRSGATPDAGWLVQVSIAEISRDGPFSNYAGVDRWFAVLDGAGVRLDLPSGPVALAPGDEPLGFAGKAAPHCALLQGATLDLNLMLARAARASDLAPGGRPAMRLAHAGSALRGRWPWRAVYVHAPARLLVEDEDHELPAGTLAWSDANLNEAWQLPAAEGLAFWMTLASGVER